MKVMKMPRNTRIAPKAQEAFFPLGAHKMHTAEDLGIYIVRFYTLNSGHGPSQATLSFILGSPLAQHASRMTAILQATSNSFSRFASSAPNRQIKGQ